MADHAADHGKYAKAGWKTHSAGEACRQTDPVFMGAKGTLIRLWKRKMTRPRHFKKK